MKRIFLLVLVLWGILAPITYHPDTKLTLRYPALENGKVWDIYAYLDKNKLDIPDFHYPPAHYWWLKIHYPISKFIGGNGFDAWLSSGSAQAGFDVNVLRYNLAAKLPLIILGLVSGWLIFLIVKRACGDKEKAKKAALFWYFNPITLYSLVMMGQNDIVAIFLFLLGLWLIDRWWVVAVLWGLAAGVKNYPIIWSIMFLLVWEKNIPKLIIKTGSVLMVYFLILVPWLGKDYFVQAVLNSGLSQRMFIANIPIGFNKEVLIAPLLLVFIALKTFFRKNQNKIFEASFLIFQSCLIILAFSHFNPQWMLWTVPFLSIWLFGKGSTKKDWLPILVILGVWIVLTLGFDDKFLTWGIFNPLNPNLVNFPSLMEFAKNKNIDLSTFINLAQSILAGVSIWYISKKIKINKNKSLKINKWLVVAPWCLFLFLVLILVGLKTENKINSEASVKEVPLMELKGQNWSYETKNNLKYFEISLNNPGLDSQDKGVLVVTDDIGNKFEKEFSGFNAGVNSWLRVDLPKEMANSHILKMEVKDVVINDGFLKAKIDTNNKWVLNFYNYGNISLIDVAVKVLAVWWWWLGLIGVSIFFFKSKEN